MEPTWPRLPHAQQRNVDAPPSWVEAMATVSRAGDIATATRTLGRVFRGVDAAVCVCVCECARSQARRSLAFVTDQIARTKIYNAIRTSFSPMNLARLRCMQYCVVAYDRVVVCITLSVYLVIVRIIAYFLVNNHLYEYATAYKYYNRHIVSL